MVLISGHHAKVWATVAAPNSSDLCTNVRRVICTESSGRTPGCCSTAVYLAPSAVKFVRHVVPPDRGTVYKASVLIEADAWASAASVIFCVFYFLFLQFDFQFGGLTSSHSHGHL